MEQITRTVSVEQARLIESALSSYAADLLERDDYERYRTVQLTSFFEYEVPTMYKTTEPGMYSDTERFEEFVRSLDGRVSVESRTRNLAFRDMVRVTIDSDNVSSFIGLSRPIIEDAYENGMQLDNRSGHELEFIPINNF